MHDDGAREPRCLQNIDVVKYICKERNLDRAPHAAVAQLD